jgi:hypothetical protein
MTNSEHGFLPLASSAQVVRPAIKVAIVVGTVLVLINHGDAVLKMSLTTSQFLKILLTYLVPYCVSTYSAVKAIQGQAQERR